MKILYVEDNDDNVYMLKTRLSRAGFTVVVATDGAQGIAMATSEQPDLILNRVAGHLQVPCDLPDRLAFDEVLAPNPADRLHCQHSPSLLASNQSKQHIRPMFRGVNFGRRSPAQAVKIARRLTNQ